MNASEFKSRIDGIQNAIKKIAAGTLNDTAYDVQQALKKEISSIFDRPTPYIKKSVVYGQATETKQYAVVGLVEPSEFAGDYVAQDEGGSKFEYRKDQTGGPAPAALVPHIFGGSRAPKRSEQILREIGAMGNDQFIVPGKNAPLDQYGNISGKDMTRILSAVSAFRTSGFDANQTAKSRKRKRFVGEAYIIPKVGIFWRVTEKTSYPILLFVSAPQYAARFDFYGIAKTMALKNLKKNFKPNWRANIK